MSMETFRYTPEGEQYIETGNEIAKKAEKMKRPRIKNLVGRTNPDGTGWGIKSGKPTEAKTSENVNIHRPDFSLQRKIKECEEKGFYEIDAGSFLLCGSEREGIKMSKGDRIACIKYLMDKLIEEQDRQAAANRAVREKMNKANVQGA